MPKTQVRRDTFRIASCGGAGRFNATAFYSSYTDLQIQITGSTVVNDAPQPFNVITNVPKANIKGGEAELTISPAQGLTLNGALGLTFAEYTKLPTSSVFVSSGVISLDSGSGCRSIPFS